MFLIPLYNCLAAVNLYFLFAKKDTTEDSMKNHTDLSQGEDQMHYLNTEPQS